jgi:hypothetical protein
MYFYVLIDKNEVVTVSYMNSFSHLKSIAAPGDTIYTIRRLEDKTLQVTDQYTKPGKQIRVLNAKPIVSNQETTTHNSGLSIDKDDFSIPF